ncbi:hypothetical protein [Vibrio taketomensis]|uniref:hypothetical protein n=1 Tax=Vibrio taketomensis TaxID=2572923 RepID=UPI0038CD72E3
MVLDEPSVVAIRQDRNRPGKVCGGRSCSEANAGRTPGNISAIRPERWRYR